MERSTSTTWLKSASSSPHTLQSGQSTEAEGTKSREVPSIVIEKSRPTSEPREWISLFQFLKEGSSDGINSPDTSMESARSEEGGAVQEHEGSGSNFNLSKSFTAPSLPSLPLSTSQNGSTKKKKVKDRQNRASQLFLQELKEVSIPSPESPKPSPKRSPSSNSVQSAVSRQNDLPEITPRESSSPTQQPKVSEDRGEATSQVKIGSGSQTVKETKLERKRNGSLARIFSSIMPKKNRKDGKSDLEISTMATSNAAEDDGFYTFEKMIEKLTTSTPDISFQAEFLTSFHSVTTAPDLLSALLKTFEDADGPTKTVTQLRVMHVIRSWFEDFHFNWRAHHAELLAMILEVRKRFNNRDSFNKVMLVFDRLLEKIESSSGDRPRWKPTASSPLPIMPQKLSRLNVLAIDPLELARQMTLIDSSLLMKVEPREFQHLEWMKPQGRVNTPNINNCIMRFNITSRWVVSEILREEETKTRVHIIRHFLKTAEHLVTLKNFNGALQIASAFDTHAVYRLKGTFSQLTEADSASLARLQAVCDSSGNHRGLWNKILQSELPCIPYLGLFLSAFNIVAETAPNTSEDGKFNWSRRRQFTKWINDFTKYQQVPYDIRSVPLIKDFILNAEVFDDDTYYEMSYFIEPKISSSGNAKPQKKPALMRHIGLSMSSGKGRKESKTSSRSLLQLREKLKARETTVVSNDLTFVGFISKLVSNFDVRNVTEVLVAYHGLCSSEDLLSSIFDQITNAPDNNRHLIQLNSLRILRLWVEDHWSSFYRDLQSLTKLINEFWEENKNKESFKLKNEFSQLLDQIQDMIYTNPEDVNELAAVGPKPIIPSARKSEGALQLLDISPLELARQIALTDQELFAALRPWEFHEKRWTWTSKHHVAPNICKILEFQESIRGWAVGEILTEADLNRRRLKMEHLVETVNNLLEMKNFSGVHSLIEAFNHPAVARLEKTLSGLTKGSKKELIAAQQLIANKEDYSLLRSFYRRSLPPLVPLLQMYLDAFSRVDDFHSLFKAEDGAIDHSRLRKQADLLLEIRNNQMEPYRWIPLPQIMAYLNAAPIFDDKAAMELSLYFEPDMAQASLSKPFFLMNSQERAKLGYYESDNDWMAKFPIAFFPVKTTKEKPIIKLHHGKTIIMGATMEKLIEIITLRPEHCEESQILLNTFRDFCTPEEFFEKLRARWNLPRINKRSTSVELQVEYENKLVNPVQMRIIAILSDWLSQHILDFERSMDLKDSVKFFLESVVSTKFPTKANSLRKALYQLPSRCPLNPPMAIGPFPTRLPVDCLSVDFNALEVARQITLMEERLFSQIRIEDLINPNFPNAGPSLRLFDDWNQSLTFIVTSDVAKVENTPQAKGKLIAHWCYVVQNLHSMKNWSSLVPILKGIRTFMSDTESWKSVPPDLVHLVIRLDQIMSQPNLLRSAVYQNLDHNRSIPCLAPILEDIEFVKSKTFPALYLKAESKTINFERCKAISEVLDTTVIKVKRNPYPFAEIPPIIRWLEINGQLGKVKARSDSSSVSDKDFDSLVAYVKELEGIINTLPSAVRPRVTRPTHLIERSDVDSTQSSEMRSPPSSTDSTPRLSASSEASPRMTSSHGLPRTPSQLKRDRNSSDLRNPSSVKILRKKFELVDSASDPKADDAIKAEEQETESSTQSILSETLQTLVIIQK